MFIDMNNAGVNGRCTAKRSSKKSCLIYCICYKMLEQLRFSALYCVVIFLIISGTFLFLLTKKIMKQWHFGVLQVYLSLKIFPLAFKMHQLRKFLLLNAFNFKIVLSQYHNLKNWIKPVLTKTVRIFLNSRISFNISHFPLFKIKHLPAH